MQTKNKKIVGEKVKMNTINFSHKYTKLYNQKSAWLLFVVLRDRSDLSDIFVEYDTVFEGGNYPLPKSLCMLLVFLGNENIPFSTVRKFTEEKFQYYKSRIGSEFKIVITNTSEIAIEKSCSCILCGCKGNCSCGAEPVSYKKLCTLNSSLICPCCKILGKEENIKRWKENESN